MKTSKAICMLFHILSFLFYPAFCYFRYNDQNSLPNSILFCTYYKEHYAVRYVITSCMERFITLASTKLILHDGIVDKALSLKLIIRKLIIKELAESSEFIRDTIGWLVTRSFAFISPAYCAFAVSQMQIHRIDSRRSVSTFDVERIYLTSKWYATAR